jgi:hypothetical protein
MALDFKEMKDRIKLVDVLLHYNVRLRKKPDEDYASAACPLPCHPKKPNSAFGVHLPTNRWQCKDKECGKKNGVGDRWGDCLNLVMTLNNYGFRQAANQLDTWFPTDNKNPAHMERGVVKEVKGPSHPNILDNKSSPQGVKYMASIELWFDEVSKRRDKESDEEYRKRFVNALKAQMLQSYRAGKAAAKV